MQAAAFYTLFETPGAWWSQQTFSRISMWAGLGIGCLVILIRWLVGRGKAPKFVLTALACLIVLGVALSGLGLAALLFKQPVTIWMPMLLTGLVIAGMFSIRFRYCRKQFCELEMRRMISMDAATR